MQTFASIENFYTEDPLRRLSPEYDFGVWWKDNAEGTWRVSWVADTGEVYALRRGPMKSQTIMVGDEVITITQAGTPGLEGPLVLLGEIPASDGECIKRFCSNTFHDIGCPGDKAFNVEQALEGWADICGAPDSLSWVKERVS